MRRARLPNLTLALMRYDAACSVYWATLDRALEGNRGDCSLTEGDVNRHLAALAWKAEEAADGVSLGLHEDTKDRNSLDNCLLTKPETLGLWCHRFTPRVGATRLNVLREWVIDDIRFQEAAVIWYVVVRDSERKWVAQQRFLTRADADDYSRYLSNKGRENEVLEHRLGESDEPDVL